MRIYVKYFLVIFILIWALGVFYMFFTNENPKLASSSNQRVLEANLGMDEKPIDQYKLEFKRIKEQYTQELMKAKTEIRFLKEQNEKNEEIIAQLK